ncbi:MAG: hypothetical protein C0623_05050 [Desulfuromonas sp.]|nr:MAG: hypothetical protein C0623_05050 [Desulfuromonas sp.]
MAIDKITVQSEAGKGIEVAVIDINPHVITVAIGEGIHNVKCKLLPTENGRAYVGNVMGREIVYEKSVEEIKKMLGVGKIERKNVKR